MTAEDLGPVYTAGNSFRARAEARQREYRRDVLGVGWVRHGHWLDTQAANAGANFVCPEIFMARGLTSGRSTTCFRARRCASTSSFRWPSTSSLRPRCSGTSCRGRRGSLDHDRVHAAERDLRRPVGERWSRLRRARRGGRHPGPLHHRRDRDEVRRAGVQQMWVSCFSSGGQGPSGLS